MEEMQYYSHCNYRRKLVLIAVMSAIAVVSRSMFYMLPQVKPMAAVILITGAAVGRRSGALTGMVSALVSNFIFGQGPWTLWQMVAFGLLGYLSGCLFSGKQINGKKRLVIFALFSGASVFLLYGFIMDTGAAFMSFQKVNSTILLATYISGAPLNAIHGISTLLFVFLMGNALFRKLYRIQKKYGL
ncbi:MAG: ECF transporter S component [Lachnospiraceae bacterium]|nr:ECF transporter S component [Lachnospiraceae bacterium]